jgi:hypothetical protein
VRRSLFYGYVVAAAGFWVWFVTFGIHLTFTVFFVPVSTEFHWTRADTALASSLSVVMMGLLALMMGILWIFENVVGAGVGVWLAGYVFDMSGNYWPMYWTGLGIAIGAVILAAMVKPMQKLLAR